MRLQSLSRLLIAAVVVFSFPMILAAAETIVPTDAFDAPSKLCTPKKPITCRAGEIAATPEVAAPAPVELALTESLLESQQAALCWVRRGICRSEKDLNTPAETTFEIEEPVAPVVSQQAALCWVRRGICRSENDLNTPAETTFEIQEPVAPVVSQQAALCWVRRGICRSENQLTSNDVS